MKRSQGSEQPISFDIIIPTYKPGAEFARLLKRLSLQTLRAENIIIVNTDKSLWNDDLIRGFENIKVVHIAKEEFRHGRARNTGVSLSDADICVFMTQDALPADKKLTEELLRPIGEGRAQLSYARQLAKKDADPIERITRRFNYPGESRINSSDDLGSLGIKTYFFSNVCSAIKRRVFDELGGFHDELMFNEDMIFAAEAIKAGYKTAYCALARVFHSHNYTGKQQYERNFEVGRSQAMYEEIFAGLPSENEGVKLVCSTAKELIKTAPLYIFKLVWISACKYLGYLAGKRSVGKAGGRTA